MEPVKTPLHIHVDTDINALECPGFKALSNTQKMYAYHFTRAAWAGAKICYFQRSYEAPGLFYIFVKIFNLQTPQEIQSTLLAQDFTPLEVKAILAYVAGFFQNCGNYTSFGDTKFIPEVSLDRFWEFITKTNAYKEDSTNFDKVWTLVQFETFQWQKPYGLIDLVEKEGQNGYYSSNLKTEFLESLSKVMQTKNISVINTRVVERDGRVVILIGSCEDKLVKDFAELDGHHIDLQYGDFSPFLTNLVDSLKSAAQFTASQAQENMLREYIDHFIGGDMDKHKESQKHWIQDRGPIIETNIGFIETYLDPLKVRAEFEGFVSIVNQDESKILNNLVESAEKFTSYLPWPKEFECETFKRPDFTSLEVIAFACSGTPVGINIPNYDDIRQNFGFKNVNLGNVYGQPNIKNVRFLVDSDADLFVKYYKESLFVIVALHELLGHGTGKLFMQDKDGKLNYQNVINPFTEESVTTFYNFNEQWHARFGELSGGYEECKADAVALFLSTFDEIIEVLVPHFNKEQRDECVYTGWLEIIYSALKGLEHYSVEQQKWGQPHVLASYVIFQALQAEDPDMIKLTPSERDGKPYFYVNLDRSKIWTVGKTAIGKLLSGLQIYKSVGDGENGMKFFNQYTKVSDQMVKIRATVMLHKTPRKLELQPDLKLVGDDVQLINFDKTFEGIILSQVFHHGGSADDVLELFLTTQQLFRGKKQ